MKRFLIVLFTLLTAVGVTGCNGEEKPPESADSKATSTGGVIELPEDEF